jgi:hypothetical protein
MSESIPDQYGHGQNWKPARLERVPSFSKRNAVEKNFVCHCFSCEPPRRVLLWRRVTTLAEVKTAVDALSAAEQQQLMLHLAARLRIKGKSAKEKQTSCRDRKTDWMAEDEAAMRRFRPDA